MFVFNYYVFYISSAINFLELVKVKNKMMIYSIRGAVTVKKNSVQEIELATCNLLLEIIKKNNLEIKNITQIIFSATRDITKIYPAVYARKIGIVNASLFCVQEMYVENSLPMCIRVLLNFCDKYQADKKIFNIYLGEAKKLRPDLG